MAMSEISFGRAVSSARKALRMSQKDLASKVMKDEGGGPISPQYLNDIEHNRRSPTSDHLIREFARVLGENEGYLFFLAGKIPEDMRQAATDRATIVESFAHFRKTVAE